LGKLAIFYEHQGRYQDAIRVYAELAKRYKNSPLVLNNLAYLYAEYSKDRAQLQQAEEMVLKALSLRPGNPSYIDTAGWVAYRLGKLDLAWRHVQDALSKLPEPGIFHLNAAIIAHGLGKQKETEENLKKAIAQRADASVRNRALALKTQWQL